MCHCWKNKSPAVAEEEADEFFGAMRFNNPRKNSGIAYLISILKPFPQRLLLDSRVFIGQFLRNELFLKVFHEGRNRYRVFGKSLLISSAYVLFMVCKTPESNKSLPFKVKKLEDSFLLTITGLVEEVLLSTKDTQEMKNVYEALFAAMKSYFDTPYLDFTSGDFLRRTLP
jgi:hypothetical protein